MSPELWAKKAVEVQGPQKAFSMADRESREFHGDDQSSVNQLRHFYTIAKNWIKNRYKIEK